MLFEAVVVPLGAGAEALEGDYEGLAAVAVYVFAVHIGEAAAAVEQVVGAAQGEGCVEAFDSLAVGLEVGTQGLAYHAFAAGHAFAVDDLDGARLARGALGQEAVVAADEAEHGVGYGVAVEVEAFYLHDSMIPQRLNICFPSGPVGWI